MRAGVIHNINQKNSVLRIILTQKGKKMQDIGTYYADDLNCFSRPSFALSCDDPSGPQVPGICVCQPNYVGDRCQYCGPGYYGQPEVIGECWASCVYTKVLL